MRDPRRSDDSAEKTPSWRSGLVRSLTTEPTLLLSRQLSTLFVKFSFGAAGIVCPRRFHSAIGSRIVQRAGVVGHGSCS